MMFDMSDLYFLDRHGVLSVNSRSVPRTGWAHRLYNPGYRLRLDPLLRGSSEVIDPIPRIVSEGSRGIFVRNNRSGDIWSLSQGSLSAPGEQPRDDGFSCSFRDRQIVWTALVHGHNLTVTVELADHVPMEIWSASLLPTGSRDLPDMSLFFHTPLPGFPGHIGVRAGFDASLGGVYCDHTEYYTRFSDIKRIQTTRHVTLLLSSVGFSGFDTDVDAYSGPGNMNHLPQAVRNGCTGSPVEGSDACLAAEMPLSAHIRWGIVATSRMELREDAIRTFQDLVTQAGAPSLSVPLPSGIMAPAQPFQVSLPKEAPSAFLTRQLGQQIDYMATTYRGERAPCIRNVLQDAQGLSAQNPEKSRHLIEQVCRFQNSDGYLPHSMSVNSWNEPRGLGELKFHDAAVWLPVAVEHYVRTTGDLALLEADIPYADGRKPATLADHLLRALTYLWNTTGNHGLPLLGDGDWNDPLNGPGRHGRGESVWLAEAFVYASRRLADLFDAAHVSGSEEIRQKGNEMASRVDSQCWTGTRYVRGFDDEGVPFGHDDDAYGSIFLNAQTWAVLADIGSKTRRRTCMETVDSLLETDFGPVTLAPSFPAYEERIGKITVKPQGANENGSVYCHAAIFKVLADLTAGRAEAAADTLSRIIPGSARCQVERTRQLPLYMPNFYYGPDAGPAAGRSSMLDSTGTAAWLSIIVSDYLFGLYPEYTNLRINPCMASSLLPARIRRTLRGATYELIGEAQGNPTTEISVNGQKLSGNLLPYAPAGSHVEIRVRVPAEQRSPIHT